jgi:hypothetical protein
VVISPLVTPEAVNGVDFGQIVALDGRGTGFISSSPFQRDISLSTMTLTLAFLSGEASVGTLRKLGVPVAVVTLILHR